MGSTTHKSNHLAKETSPYLKQHAHNPVDWYPWGKEALEKAKKENKPILLSIGYAACHWCHVMAHESFEDEETARLMNELFINIKVDREERPDLDKIYQTSHYFLTQQSGGWPLTIFLTPDDLVPFFSGTYFPPSARYQLPSFKDILKAISDVYQNRSQEVRQQNAILLKTLNQHTLTTIADNEVSEQPIHLAMESLQHSFDHVHGGFGGAPKFPHPSILEFLLQNKSQMATTTFDHMANGGIYDQLEGGFYRYTIDAKWEIPHFEKMLYDNGQLLFLYAQGAKYLDSLFFADIARKTGQWVMNKLQSAEGGYFSSFDADSEGQEGNYYLWDKSEIESLLTNEEYEIVRLYFGLDKSPNMEHRWHFYVAQSIENIAEYLKIELAQAKKLLMTAKEKLLIARNKRIPPNCDTKILSSWNSLMIKGMLTAGDNLHESRFIESAKRALLFIQQKLWVNDRLLASYKDNKAHIPAYLDDYVFLLDAIIVSLQIDWSTLHLSFAINIANTLLKYFFDEKAGGFFFTANDHEKLIYRPKTMTDEAIPSGNGVAIRVLLVLGHLIGESRYLDAAEKTLNALWPVLMQAPSESTTALLGLKDYLNPPQLIVIRGPENEIKTWQQVCKTLNNYVFAIPDRENNLPGALQLKKSRKNTCAYVCQGTQCLDVIEDLEVLKKEVL